MFTIRKIAKRVMSDKERDILIKMQLENICKCLDGEWYHQQLLNSRGERTNRFVIEYTPNE